MVVRAAEVEDIPAVKALGALGFEESNTYRGLTPDFSVLELMVLNDPSYGLFVSEDSEDGSLNGFLLGQLQRGLFFKETIATNVVFFVLKEKRGTNIPYRLANRFQAWAIANGAEQIHLSTSGGIYLMNNHRFFTGMGFRLAGILTVKEVIHGSGRRLQSPSTERGGKRLDGSAGVSVSTAGSLSGRAELDCRGGEDSPDA